MFIVNARQEEKKLKLDYLNDHCFICFCQLVKYKEAVSMRGKD